MAQSFWQWRRQGGSELRNQHEQRHGVRWPVCLGNTEGAGGSSRKQKLRLEQSTEPRKEATACQAQEPGCYPG